APGGGVATHRPIEAPAPKFTTSGRNAGFSVKKLSRLIGSSSRSRPVFVLIQCVRVWSGKFSGTRSLPLREAPIAARPLKFSENGAEVLMYALACFDVCSSPADPSRVQFSRKNTRWSGLVKSNGNVLPTTVGTTGEVISKTETCPLAESLKNGRS